VDRYGEAVRAQMEKRLGLWVGLGAAVIVFGFVVVVWAF
jgi:hypothetical protein